MSTLANLRAQADALGAFRDRMSELLPPEEYDRLADLMVPWTDDLLERLQRLEMLEVQT